MLAALSSTSVASPYRSMPASTGAGTPPSAREGEEAVASSAASRGEEGAARGGVGEPESATKPNGETLTEQELHQLERLKTTDREVRQHEMAHQITGGPYAGSASYDFEQGPDGQRYAVAGEVPIDYGPVAGDPRATIDKMQTVIAAALAPADPSPKDHQVAATARQYLLTAQLELAQQQGEARQAPNADEASPMGRGAATYARMAEPDDAQASLQAVA